MKQHHDDVIVVKLFSSAKILQQNPRVRGKN